ncbi:MAG: NAD(P)-binding domain-containing protein, partial [Spirochaetia bacterium]|nr:NAD(P)-binding domain-containing protein [Spirochaetia bacterium]
MPKINKALIAGAGAIGAAIASRIFDVDPDAIALAASGERKQRYLRDGFIVNGKRYDFRLADSTMAEPYDLIILAVKNYDLESAIEEIRPFFGENTTILSLLNGITSEQILRAEFGKDAVPLAFIIGIDALRAGNRIDFPRPGEIRFGDEKNDPDNLRPAIAEIADFLKSHNVPYSIPGDMVRAMWYKFMMNVGLNQ